MAARAALELEDGMYVKSRQLVFRHMVATIPDGMIVTLQSETACWAWGRSPMRRRGCGPDYAGKQTSLT